MKGLSKFLGRGLLVLALGSYVVACGDDDDDDNVEPDGGGTGGSTAGKGGAGGSTAGKGGAGSDGSMTEPTVAECMDDASTMTGGMVTDECSECLCEMAPQEVSVCTAACWGLAQCVAAKCPALADGTDDIPCISAMCEDFIAAAPLAREVPFRECGTECFTVPPPPDAEVDAGN